MCCQWCSEQFSLVRTLTRHDGHVITYPIVIGGGGGVHKYIIKGKNPCSNMGGNFEIMGRNCNTSRLLCRAVRGITLFNFIAIGFEGVLFRENFMQ